MAHWGRVETFRRAGDGMAGYLALVEAACFLEVDRRWTPSTDEAETALWVDQLAERLGYQGLNVTAAERLIRAVLGHGDIDDLSDPLRTETEMVVLAGLIIDRSPGPEDLDAVLAEARAMADRWLATPKRPAPAPDEA